MGDLSVAFVVYSDFMLLDLAGPMDVFRMATLLGGPTYHQHVVSPDGAPTRASSGVVIHVDAALSDPVDQRYDTMIVVGGPEVSVITEEAAALAGLRHLADQSDTVASVCTGALVLAAGGLLDGYQATTHWAAAEQLAVEHPEVTVLPDRIFVRDRDRWTSAGISAGIDLALAMVERDAGIELAHTVARWMVVFARRPGGQSQFSATMDAAPARTEAIAEVQRWLPANLQEDLSVTALAERSRMSRRHFARAFAGEVGVTPAVLVERLRVEQARRLLETTDRTVAVIATDVGFTRAETLHRAFSRRTGTTPDSYRKHFQRS